MARRHSIFSGSRFVLKALVFALVATAVWLLANLGNIREFLDAYHDRKTEEEQIAMLRGRIETEKGRQRSLERGGLETERQVRERFRMHKPGEQVIFIEETDEPTTKAAGAASGTANRSGGAAAGTTAANAEATGTTGRQATTARADEPASTATAVSAAPDRRRAPAAGRGDGATPAVTTAAAPEDDSPVALPSRVRLDGSRALPGPARMP
jgi:hypothetical protein